MAVTFQDYFETLDGTGHKVALANQWIRLMPTGGGAGVLSDAKTDPQGRCQFTAAPQGIPLTVEYSDTGVGGAGTAIGTAPWVATGDTAYFAPGGAGGGGGGMANPMTAVGDVIVGGAVVAGVAAPARLGRGAAGQVLRVNPITLALEWSAVGLSNTNEDLASVLINATSPGDLGNCADHFLGGALGGAWAGYGNAVTTSVKNSSLAIVNLAANADGGIRRAFTPGGACRVVVRAIAGMGFEIGGAAIAGGAPSDSVYIAFSLTGSGQPQLNHRVGGAASGVVAAGPTFPPGGRVYLALERDGADNWTASWSHDRAGWTVIGTVHQVIAVTHMYLGRYWQGDMGAVDFVDVES